MSLFLGSIIRESARIGSTVEKNLRAPRLQQQAVLRRLLRIARHTAFGRYYGFGDLLWAEHLGDAFQRRVPAHDYNALYKQWWIKAHQEDRPDVCWPGQTPYFALSSGTSEAATKYIPLTEDMLRMMKQGSRRMFYNLREFEIPAATYAKQMLLVGSCTQPKQEGRHLTGDLSGLLGMNRPLWMERAYRPGKHITDLPDWNERIEYIAREAPKWDIGFSVSNPMWLQIILERILEKHGLQHIHEIWPHFSVLVHGGVFFEPYRPGLEQMFGRPVQFIDSYMASEGLFAWQTRRESRSMRLVTDGGIYYEFVPFNSENFNENGDLIDQYPQALGLNEVKEGVNYALLLSTCAGAWRYLLGDTLQFTDLERCEIRLTGRTKQYLSACGEHLSIDNLNAAVQAVQTRCGVNIGEFTVGAVQEGTRWAHQWFISCDHPDVSAQQLAKALDAELCRLNDDYAVERQHALTEVRVKLVPPAFFMDWLAQRGKLNGQAKIPRVIKSFEF